MPRLNESPMARTLRFFREAHIEVASEALGMAQGIVRERKLASRALSSPTPIGQTPQVPKVVGALPNLATRPTMGLHKAKPKPAAKTPNAPSKAKPAKKLTAAQKKERERELQRERDRRKKERREAARKQQQTAGGQKAAARAAANERAGIRPRREAVPKRLPPQDYIAHDHSLLDQSDLESPPPTDDDFITEDLQPVD